MVRIRMQRLGRTNRPFYRIGAMEKRTRRNGPLIELLGTYDPLEKDAQKQVKLNEERVKFWLSKGAQPTDTVRDMFAKRGLVDVKAWETARGYDKKQLAERLAKAPAPEAKKEEKKA
ncbi:30S ribosomal protein S16 [Phycisphaerales bacterium]|nr:30S ribosomal protein S16 [Phycisphaerales bacterium]